MDFSAEEQYLSMMRAYAPLHALGTDTGNTVVLGHAAADAARHFFTVCYHLKDYLSKDSRVPDANRLEHFTTASIPLSIAANVCNSLKHAGLKKPPRGGQSFDAIHLAHKLVMPAGMGGGEALAAIKGVKISDGDSLAFSFQPGLARAVASSRVVLTVIGRKYDGLAVAAQCIQEWDRFLSQFGLAFPKKEV